MGNPLSSRIDRTQLHMVSRDDVARVAHSLLYPANHERGPLLAAGMALLFAAVSERTGMDPQELYLLGRRILREPYPNHFQSNVQMDALRDFAGLRINVNPSI